MDKIEQALEKQYMDISAAIDLFRAALDEIASLDDEPTWKDVARYAKYADVAKIVLEYFEK